MTRVWSEDDKHCLECDYHFLYKDNVCCDYIMQTGQRRGCKPGLGCKRFQAIKPGEKTVVPVPHYGITQKHPDTIELNRDKMNELRKIAGSLVNVDRALGLSYRRMNQYYMDGSGSRRIVERIKELYGIDIAGKPGDSRKPLPKRDRSKPLPENFQEALDTMIQKNLRWQDGAALCGMNTATFRTHALKILGDNPLTRTTKRVEKLDPQGNVVEVYESVKEAAGANGYDEKYMFRIVRTGKRFRYAEEE